VVGERQASDCYRRGNAARFRVSPETFTRALEASVAAAFAARPADASAIERYLSTLHLEDLALACACATGDGEAWDHFVLTYRPALYRTADALDPSGGARDLADSLYGDLYGLGGDVAERRSLFRYFHGRSSLATWLRAVLAQRHVDRIRDRRKLGPLPDDRAPDVPIARVPPPEHERFVASMRAALVAALACLTSDDRLRLSCYYARQMTLAQIGRLCGEHEATVSRQLARARTAIRHAVERELRDVHGLDEGAILECFRSVAADSGPLDLGELLGRKNAGVDRSKDESCA
jgi:RNA polymerase sigma factor (sigma-70 family)